MSIIVRPSAVLVAATVASRYTDSSVEFSSITASCHVFGEAFVTALAAQYRIHTF